MTILLLACVAQSTAQPYGEIAVLQELLKMPSERDYDDWDIKNWEQGLEGRHPVEINLRLTESAKKIASFPQKDIRRAYVLIQDALYGLFFRDAQIDEFFDDYYEAREQSQQPALNLFRTFVKRKADEYDLEYEQRLTETVYLIEQNGFILNRIMFDCYVTDDLKRPLLHYYNFVNWNTPELALNRQRPVVLKDGLWSIDIEATGWGGSGPAPDLLREYEYYSRRFNLRDLSNPTTDYGGERADLSPATATLSTIDSSVVQIILTMSKMPTVRTYFNAEPGTAGEVDKRVTQVAWTMQRYEMVDVRSAIETVVKAYKEGDRAPPSRSASYDLIRSLYSRGEDETSKEHDYRVQTMIVHLYHNTYFLNRLMFDCDVDDDTNDSTVYTHGYNTVSSDYKLNRQSPVVFRDGHFGIDWGYAEWADWDGFLDPLEEFDFYRKKFDRREISIS